MRRRRAPEIITGIVNADGSINRGDGFTVQKSGAGQYTLFFPSGFRLMGFTMAKVGADTPFYLGGPTDRTVQVVSVSSIAAGGVDAAFSFIAVGIQQ